MWIVLGQGGRQFTEQPLPDAITLVDASGSSSGGDGAAGRTTRSRAPAVAVAAAQSLADCVQKLRRAELKLSPQKGSTLEEKLSELAEDFPAIRTEMEGKRASVAEAERCRDAYRQEEDAAESALSQALREYDQEYTFFKIKEEV